MQLVDMFYVLAFLRPRELLKPQSHFEAIVI